MPYPTRGTSHQRPLEVPLLLSSSAYCARTEGDAHTAWAQRPQQQGREGGGQMAAEARFPLLRMGWRALASLSSSS